MPPVPASEARLEDLVYSKRALVVFAPSAQDFNFVRQMELLADDRGDLEERNVVVIIDTDPAAQTAIRQKLRPSGFAVVIVDKDGKVAQRKPSPRTLREIVRDIDKFPSRREEMLQR